MTYYRTRTYIASDWDGDSNLIEQLRAWNDNNRWSLSFTDAHDLMQASDTSLPCSIKASLRKRMDASKTFVLIVGEHTNNLTKGSCQYCREYSSYFSQCNSGYSLSMRSFIDYECDKAAKDDLKIVVLYNSTSIDKNKCPEAVRWIGNHAAAIYRGSNGELHWDYNSVKNAIDS